MREEATYAVGKGKPPRNRRFGQPEGNPNGKTSEQKKLELLNAESAMRIRERLLRATEARLAEMSTEEVMALIEPSMLKLLTDSETRGLGAPVQDIRSGDGSLSPKPTVIEFIAPKAADENDD